MKRSADFDSHNRFGKSRDPPITSRSWWKQTEIGQPRAAEKACSVQSTVAAVLGSGCLMFACACVGEATLEICSSLSLMRSRAPIWSSENTGAEAVICTEPVVPLACKVTHGAANL